MSDSNALLDAIAQALDDKHKLDQHRSKHLQLLHCNTGVHPELLWGLLVRIQQ